MKVFAIRDNDIEYKKDVAYLVYYEKAKKFYIEIPDDATENETPLIMSSFLKRGIKTVNSYWSKVWVQQRIVPPDRQNIGMVLKDNGLKEYDEYKLLMLGNGRCAQDECYLVPISENELLEKFKARYAIKVMDILALEDFSVLVFFRNGITKKCDMQDILNGKREFAPILKNKDYFDNVNIQTGGYGICWGENLLVADFCLYEKGETVPLSINDFKNFVSSRVVNAYEASEILNCSRQNINDLIKRDKLHPLKVDAKNTLFMKSEVVARTWS
jgi:hypothetical protein